jgi:hypothetical protein
MLLYRLGLSKANKNTVGGTNFVADLILSMAQIQARTLHTVMGWHKCPFSCLIIPIASSKSGSELPRKDQSEKC